MVLCALSPAYDAVGKDTCRCDGLRNYARGLNSLDRHKVLRSVAAMAANEKACVLPSRILAATHHPLLRQLAIWTGILGPREWFLHALSLTPELSGGPIAKRLIRPLERIVRRMCPERGRHATRTVRLLARARAAWKQHRTLCAAPGLAA